MVTVITDWYASGHRVIEGGDRLVNNTLAGTFLDRAATRSLFIPLFSAWAILAMRITGKGIGFIST